MQLLDFVNVMDFAAILLPLINFISWSVVSKIFYRIHDRIRSVVHTWYLKSFAM